MAEKIKILGFAGSLRKDSYNKALLRTALEVLPPGVELEIFDIEGIPPFNQDLEASQPAPESKRLQGKDQGSGCHPDRNP